MKTPIYLNASSLHDRSCGRFLYYQNIEGTVLRTTTLTPQLNFGSAVHKGIERIFKGQADAIEATVAEYALIKQIFTSKTAHLTTGHLVTTLAEVLRYLNSVNFSLVKSFEGVPLCEIKFAEALVQNDRYVVIMSGTMDMLLQYTSGGYVVGDWKTTSAAKPEEYLEQYEFSHQLMAYRWFIWQRAKAEPESIFAKLGNALAYQVFAITTSASKPVRVVPSQVYTFQQDQLEEYDAMLRKFAQKFLDFSANKPPREGLMNGACHAGFSTCPYLSLCNNLGVPHYNATKQARYKPQTYNPLTFR